MDLSARIVCERDRCYRLQLQGRLTPLWPSQLTTALASHRIGILSGRAKGTGLNWNAEFLLDFTASTADPESLDYATLAKTETPAELGGTVRLSRYTCSQLPDGRLEARVFGPDQSGFLARLLCRMVLLGLFPTEFDINTQGDQIDDRFVLVCTGGASASAAVHKSLDNLLRSFCCV